MAVKTITEVKVTLPPWLARKKEAAQIMKGEILEERDCAILFHGIADVNSTVCCECGKELTNPLSVALGIGPVCGQTYGLHPPKLEDLTPELIAAYRSKITSREVEAWLPKSQITIEVISTRTVAEEAVTPAPRAPKPSEHRNDKKAVLDKDIVKITFPFEWDTLNVVRSIPGRKFNDKSQTKYWTAPITLDTVQILEANGFDIDPAITQKLAPFTVVKTAVDDIAPINIPGLYPFQQKGVGFIESRNGRALIADQMGLGKTVQALAWLGMHPEKRPAIIVVPASVKLNWKREAEKWITEPNVQLLYGKKPYNITGDILIINYDILSAWVKPLQDIGLQVVVMDECHYIKNNNASRTKAAQQLVKDVPHLIGLSGTPIVNRPIEFFNVIKMINPGVIPDWWQYVNRYCAAKHTGYGWDVSGASNTEELHDKLVSTVMLRRLKKDVLTDLPDKVRGVVPLELTNFTDYNNAETNFLAWLKEQDEEAALRASRAQQLAKIEHLKQLAAEGKMPMAIEWIREFVESNGKLVVFAIHTAVIDELMKAFGPIAVKIDGSVPVDERQAIVDRFQTDDSVRLFVGNIKAAGVGITLTAASSVAFLELPWTPGELEQAEDRCHRIGQVDSVNVYYLLAAGTIDEKIASILDEKRTVLDSVLDGGIIDEASAFAELIDNMSNLD